MTDTHSQRRSVWEAIVTAVDTQAGTLSPMDLIERLRDAGFTGVREDAVRRELWYLLDMGHLILTPEWRLTTPEEQP